MSDEMLKAMLERLNHVHKNKRDKSREIYEAAVKAGFIKEKAVKKADKEEDKE